MVVLSENLNDLTIIHQVFRGDAVFEQAFQKAQIANLNKQEWMDYEMSLKAYRDNRGWMLIIVKLLVKKE